MDFQDSPAEARFRTEVRRWLETHAPRRDEGDGAFVPAFEGTPQRSEAAWVERCRRWQRCKHDAGFSAICWPREWGGRGGTAVEEAIFADEEAQFAVDTGAFDITLGSVAPTLMVHGTPDQRQHVAAVLRGDEVWCQMFSEPSAGSDLAAVRTRAVPDGDAWILDGQKVWTSGAQYAQWGYLLARSNGEVPKHAGLTAFLVRMDAPGITVRPLRQMTGHAGFNEVFLDGVRVDDATGRLGPVDGGWRVAVTTLMKERFSLSGGRAAARNFAAVVELARRRGLLDHPVVRQELADLHIRFTILRYTNARALTAVSNGGRPGPEGSIGKLAYVRTMRTLGAVASRVAGPACLLDGDAGHFLLGLPGLALGGGTDEVMCNVLGERLLGLPAEPAGQGQAG